MKEMKDKDLKRLSRSDLVEIIFRLQENESSLNQQIAQLQKKLNDRRIIIDNSGSIAEAALKLNSVFETAQKAADEYLSSIKHRSSEAAEAVINEADKEAQSIISDADDKRKEATEELDTKIRIIIEKAKQEADKIVADAKIQAQQIIETAEKEAGKKNE